MDENTIAEDKNEEGPVPSLQVSQEEPVVSDEMLLGIYSEILDTVRQDRLELSDILNNFCDMVMNEGDSSSASKEVIAQLVKTKMDASDKMAKVAELMTRMKLREKDKGSFVTTSEGTVINIGDNGSKRGLLKTLNAATKHRKRAGNE